MEGKLMIVVSGDGLGEFLAFYFDDESLSSITGEWVYHLFGERKIDLAEFKETAKRFGVNIEIRYETLNKI